MSHDEYTYCKWNGRVRVRRPLCASARDKLYIKPNTDSSGDSRASVNMMLGGLDPVTTSRNCDDDELELDVTSSHIAGVASEADATTVARSDSSVARVNAHAPMVMWSPAAQAATDEGALRPELLIIGFAGAGDAYCRASLCGDRVGVVQLPSTDRSKATLSGAAALDSTCTVHTTPGGSFKVLVVRCGYYISPETAPVWVQTLFRHVQPTRVVVLDTLKVSPAEVRGLSGPLLRALKTDALTAPLQGVEFVRPPFLVCGAPGAVLTHCQVFGIAAATFVALQVRVVDMPLLKSFDAVWGVISEWGEAVVGVGKVATQMAPTLRFKEVGKSFRSDPVLDSALYL